MKATTLIAAAALALGTAALAQAQDHTSRTENSASADSAKPADDADRTKNALHRLGEKTRNAMHRAGEKMHHVARKDDAAHEEHHNMHARADRHDRDHDRDARAMGAPRRDLRDDDDTSRRSRMDQAYENWKARHNNG